MGTLGGFPNPPAVLRCQRSWQAPHAIAAASDKVGTAGTGLMYKTTANRSRGRT
jgi:hypothetical protein